MFPLRNRTTFDPTSLNDNSCHSSNSSQKQSYCFITIKPNQGGLESRDFCSIVARMIEKYCDKNRIEIQWIENTDYITILRLGCNATKLELLKGLHKLVRVSPFGHGDKVHTSLCKIDINSPKAEKNIQINDKDIRMDFYKSTGPGGQHRNKTMSAVRLVHVPTGIMVTSAAERSQHDNRRYAMEQLLCKLAEVKKHQEMAEHIQKRYESQQQNEISISYYFNHQLALNEKSGKKTTHLKRLLNGEIDLII
jgi:peptide chain release factor 2